MCSVQYTNKIHVYKIIGDKLQIVSQGYNGFPRNIEDKEERLNIRELKYKFTIHAEANAIYNALYNGSSVQDCTLYCVSLFPCLTSGCYIICIDS